MYRVPTTTRLLEVYGHREFSHGRTCQQEWDSTIDRNWRYRVRIVLLNYWSDDMIDNFAKFVDNLNKLMQA